jgi:hypothetical protein
MTLKPVENVAHQNGEPCLLARQCKPTSLAAYRDDEFFCAIIVYFLGRHAFHSTPK